MQEALNSRKIEPKENVAVLKKLVLEVEKMSTELENNLGLLDNLEANKAEKADVQVHFSGLFRLSVNFNCSAFI